jgi:hypothetical protein
MKEVTRQLVRIFRPQDIDWMGYEIDSVYDLSYHHIQKKANGGKLTLDNGALLNKSTAHPYLHVIEITDPEMYLYINNLLKNVNTQGYAPTRQQLLAVRSILQQFEREHCSATNNRGKKLIKTQYVERRGKFL